MPGVLACLPQGARVAVIRLRSLGDCVLTTPALDILKRTRPDLRVALVVEERFRPVFEGNPHLEALLPPAVCALRAWHPRLCLNYHGGSTSALLTALSGAVLRAGFGHFRFGFVYNVKIPRAQEILGEERRVHTAEHLASAMFYLGAPAGEIPRARLFCEVRPAARPYAVIHPVASQPDKTWKVSGFLAVARHLRQAWGVDPVFVAGPGEDLGAFSEFQTLAGAPLAEVKSLIGGAALFIGNDSGPAHMAAAFGLPVVVIFGSSDVTNWRPWKSPAEVVRGPAGINSVTVEQVTGALERLRVQA